MPNPTTRLRPDRSATSGYQSPSATVRTHPRRPARLLGLALATLLAAMTLAGVGAAQAQDAFRYWTYWNASQGEWLFAQTGPGDVELTEGAVEGWMLQISAGLEPEQQPRVEPDFATLCPDAAAGEGEIAVAVVIDYGTEADAPEGEAPPAAEPEVQCVTLPQGSTGLDALTAASQPRVEEGAVCGINGYPATGCFEAVAAPAPATPSPASPSPAASDTPSAVPAETEAATDEATDEDTNIGVWLAIIAVIVAIVAVVVIRMRNNKGSETGAEGAQPEADQSAGADPEART